jgi:hypothetical protein
LATFLLAESEDKDVIAVQFRFGSKATFSGPTSPGSAFRPKAAIK